MIAIQWTAPSRDDLRHIDSWLTTRADGALAERMLVAIRDRSEFLAEFPRAGRPSVNGTRILRVLGTPYLLHYRILDDGVAQILRVHHERENWQVAV